jgi:MFS family permease
MERNENQIPESEETTKLVNVKVNCDDTMNNKSEEIESSNQEKNENSYIKIMNKRNSKYHILASALFLISILSMEFLVLQLVLLFRPILPVSRIEIITFTSLSFLGICLGWFVKNLFYDNYYVRRNILTVSTLTLGILLYLIFTRSFYILFISYPFISLFVGFILFSSRQLFEEYYLTDYRNNFSNNSTYDLRLGKNILLSISFLLVFIPFIVLVIVESNMDNVAWNIGLIPFAVVMAAILVLSYFVKESPATIYINDEKFLYYIDDLLEDINEKKLEIEEKDEIYQNIKNIINKNKSSTYMGLFRNPIRAQTILYLLTIFCFSYIHFNLLTFIPWYLLSILPITNEQRSGFFLIRIFIMLIISCWGGFIGTLTLKFVRIQRKYLVIIGFSAILILSIFLNIFLTISYILAGFILLFTNIINLILMNYAYEKYEEGLNEKALQGFKFVHYTSAFFGIILFGALYSISPVAGFITICVISLAGSILAIFI